METNQTLDSGLFAALFDLSFTKFVTVRIIKILFILAIILEALWSLIMLITTFTRGVGFGVLGLIVVPIFFLLQVIMTRVWLELIVVVFRIGENTGKLVELQSGGAAGGQ